MNLKSDIGMSFWRHLGELRTRLLRSLASIIVGFSIAYYFHKELFRALRYPFDTAYERIYHVTPNLVALSMLEGFMVYFKMSVLVGLFIASPYIFYQLWKFISPGLKIHEKKYVMPFVFLATFFFVGGALFGYFLVFPQGFEYFLSITYGDHILATIQMDQYYQFASMMLLGFGVSFEGPLILLYLVYFRVLTTKHLMRAWREATVAILILAAVITPTPDNRNDDANGDPAHWYVLVYSVIFCNPRS